MRKDEKKRPKSYLTYCLRFFFGQTQRGASGRWSATVNEFYITDSHAQIIQQNEFHGFESISQSQV